MGILKIIALSLFLGVTLAGDTFLAHRRPQPSGPADILSHSTLPTSLISHWKLEELSGSRVDSHFVNTLSDISTVTSGTGKIDTAADFEKDNSEYLDGGQGDGSILDVTGNLSIDAWFNCESLTANMPVVSKYKTSGNQRAYLLNVLSDGSVGFHVSSNGQSGGLVSAVSGTGLVSIGTWYHLAGTYNPSTSINVYINAAVTTNTTSIPASIFDSTEPFKIGNQWPVASASSFDGLIDEVNLWTKTLTSGEVTDLLAGGSGLPLGGNGMRENLRFHWALNESSGDRGDFTPSDETMSDIATVTSTAGIQGNAATFVAANSEYLNNAGGANFALGTGGESFSISLWARFPDATPATSMDLIGVFDNGSNNRNYLCRLGTNGKIDFFISDNGTNAVSVEDTNVLSDNTWYHILCTYEASTAIKIYIDAGTPTSNTTGIYASLSGPAATPCRIGARSTSTPSNFMGGDIDEISIWEDRLLVASDATWLYKLGDGRAHSEY